MFHFSVYSVIFRSPQKKPQVIECTVCLPLGNIFDVDISVGVFMQERLRCAPVILGWTNNILR